MYMHETRSVSPANKPPADRLKVRDSKHGQPLQARTSGVRVANYDEASAPAEAKAETGPRRRLAPRDPWRARLRDGREAKGAPHVEKDGKIAA